MVGNIKRKHNSAKIFQFGPSLNVNPKTFFGPKFNPKLAFNTTSQTGGM
jgi:hypothetical protein